MATPLLPAPCRASLARIPSPPRFPASTKTLLRTLACPMAGALRCTLRRPTSERCVLPAKIAGVPWTHGPVSHQQSRGGAFCRGPPLQRETALAGVHERIFAGARRAQSRRYANWDASGCAVRYL